MHINNGRKALLLGYCRLLITGVAALVISGLFALSAHAADELVTEQPVVVVTGQSAGNRETAYTLAELKSIADQDTSPAKSADNQYFYTARSTYPTKSVYKAEGVLLKTLLNMSGITDFSGQEISISDKGGVYLVRFTPSKTQPNTDLPYNTDETEIEKKISMVLGEPRYAFPNFASENSEIWENEKKPIEAVIAWAGEYGSIVDGEIHSPNQLRTFDNDSIRLFVGQLVPNDMNNPLWNGRTGQLIVCAGAKNDDSILTMEDDSGAAGKTWTRSELLRMNRAGRNYRTASVRGVPIKDLLSSYGGRTTVVFRDKNDQALSRTFTKNEMADNNYVLAYEMSNGAGGYEALTDQQTPVLKLYGDDLAEPYQVSSVELTLSLEDIRESAANELDAYLHYEDYKPAQQQEINTIISNAKAAMAAAQSFSDIQTIKQAAMRKLDDVRTANVMDATDIKRAKVSLSKTSFIYTGKVIKPTATVVLGGMTLKNGTHFKITYSANKAIGTAKAVITGTGEYWGSVTKSFAINPGKANIKKVKAGKRKLTVYRKALSGGVSYQAQIKKAGGKWKVYGFGKKASKTVTKLKSKKNYKVRVRAYKKVNNKTYYGSWSNTKTIRVK